jgi:hypothetical protein
LIAYLIKDSECLKDFIMKILNCIMVLAHLIAAPLMHSEDKQWWSRKPLTETSVPATDGWGRSEVDSFILHKLRAKNLEPSETASPRILIRRLTFDLTGLPPTPKEVKAFEKEYVSDPEGAYEELVDRLLDSPRYGERFARHWLDVAKYADTCGYDKDKLRPNAWPYRDYVIRSFNADKPYAQFVKEQIAGDFIYPDSEDGILGLGFLAAGPWDFIGHVEVPESKTDGKVARNLDRDDMVSNVFNSFCATTIQCARCHEHKGDPIGQDHYYSLQSVFAAVDKADRVYGMDPKVARKKEELLIRQGELSREIALANKEIKKKGGEKLKELDEQVSGLEKIAGKAERVPEHGYHSQVAKTANSQKWVQVDLGKREKIASVTMHACHDDFAGIGAGFGFPVRFKIIASNQVDFSRSEVLVDQTEKKFLNPKLVPVTYKVNSHARYFRVEAVELTERKNDFIFALAELELFNADDLNLAAGKNVTAKDSIEAPNRWRKLNLTDGKWPKSKNSESSRQLLALNEERETFLSSIQTDEEKQELAAKKTELKEVEKNLKALPVGKLVYAATTHFKPRSNFKPTEGKPRMIYVLHRGEVNQPREPVRPGTIPLLSKEKWEFKLPEVHDEAERRAALAEWIVRKDHPLTWRTIVNRSWQWHFGKPLVGTPNDFGPLGQLPTHPELLDWLAVYFRDSGGSFKKLHKLLVMSETYRQSSIEDEAKEKVDSSNQWLWRMNRRKLSAEEMRDSVLLVSGKLNLEMGGPGFYLFNLEQTAHSPHYYYHKFDPEDEKSHRRSIYRFVVRSQPNPFMTTLDCADSSQSTPRRNETLTALQALSLLNNKFTLVMARHFAERLSKEVSGMENQVRAGFELVTGRSPNAEEHRLLLEYADKHGTPNLCRSLFSLSEFAFID